MARCVVLYSGGQDSTTCLAWAIESWGVDNVWPLSIAYGQRHEVELDCAHRILGRFGLLDRHRTIELDAPDALGATALTDDRVDIEATASARSRNTFAHTLGLPSTFVPGRNMLFLTLAAAYGTQRGAHDLVAGVCEADAAGYPDCRADFVGAAEQALRLALGDPALRIHAPLLTRSKGETFALAQELGVLDVVVEETHTCYAGDRSVRHRWGYGCGGCPACRERAAGWERFALVGAAAG